jgi:hypothetical protein
VRIELLALTQTAATSTTASTDKRITGSSRLQLPRPYRPTLAAVNTGVAE